MKNKKEKLHLKNVEREINKSFRDLIEKKNIVAEKLNFGKMAKTAIFLRKELNKIISEIPEINENNYKEICKKFIENMELINYNINSFTASISYFNYLEEEARASEEAKKRLKNLMPIRENWNNIIILATAVNIDDFKKLYNLALEEEYLNKIKFNDCLKQIKEIFNNLKTKSILI